ncbi:MAG: hypothetical protein U0931_05795 [Vulcanimicrobiota bacterium]
MHIGSVTIPIQRGWAAPTTDPVSVERPVMMQMADMLTDHAYLGAVEQVGLSSSCTNFSPDRSLENNLRAGMTVASSLIGPPGGPAIQLCMRDGCVYASQQKDGETQYLPTAVTFGHGLKVQLPSGQTAEFRQPGEALEFRLNYEDGFSVQQNFDGRPQPAQVALHSGADKSYETLQVDRDSGQVLISRYTQLESGVSLLAAVDSGSARVREHHLSRAGAQEITSMDTHTALWQTRFGLLAELDRHQ